MARVTRWRRGLWAAGHWWSYTWACCMIRGGGTARTKQHVQSYRINVISLILLLMLLALTSAVIHPHPVSSPSEYSPNSQLSKPHSHKSSRIDRRGASPHARYRPSTASYTTHCFFNQLCSCKILMQGERHGHGKGVIQ